MSCSIHYIIQHKVGEKWEALDDQLPTLETTGYGVYGILAGVRDYYGQQVFEPKGLPADLGNTKYRWESYRKNLEAAFDESILCFVRPNERPIPVCDLHKRGIDLTFEIDEEGYALRDTAPKDQFTQFGWSRTGDEDKKYFCLNATIGGGTFETLPYRSIYDSFEEYAHDQFEDDFDVEQNDFGRYDVDFDCEDCHSASWLTLAEMQSADYSRATAHVYKMDRTFYDAFVLAGGVLPEVFKVEDACIGDIADAFREALSPTVTIVWPRTDTEKEKCHIIKILHEFEDVATKNSANADDIRIVFAFDN